MWQTWLTEIGLGIAWFFAQPLLYIVIVLSFLLGNLRIKRDRQQFGHRIFPLHAEWRGTWLLGLGLGLLVSIGLVLVGVVVTWEWLLLLTIVTLVMTLTGQLALLSPAYTLGVTIVTVWLLQQFEVVVWNESISEGLYQVPLDAMVYVLLALLLAEVILVMTTKRALTFPQLQSGDRGKNVIAHRASRLMLVPLLFPLPGGTLVLSDAFAWWPMFAMDSVNIQFVLFPYIIGFSQMFRGVFSEQGAKRIGLSVLLLMIILAGVFVPLMSVPYVLISVAGFAVVARAFISLMIRFFDRERRPIFRPEPDGITIAGIIPGSPADELDVVVGEKIERVHDVPVQNEHEFYDVMSENRSYCKLNVQDLNGETKFVQRPIHEGEDHQLGFIFVKERPRFTLQTTETLTME
ncbi:hypothetical protein ACKXGF_11590 [Alkalibacillus sp. S2W]|uniref:hypothetical protein n=1 Tax=Alkalibacillus sp. S2W TaxID=3386553 RepID=UPI00398CA03B